MAPTRVMRGSLLDLEHRPRVLVLLGEIVAQPLGVDAHRTQLEDAKDPAAAAHALLPEEHRSARVDLDGQASTPITGSEQR
jgi:hypothetical protein